MAERVSHLLLAGEEQPASRLPRQTRVVGAAAVVVAGALAVCTLAPGPGARLPPVLAQAQQQSWGRGAGRTAERNRALQSLAQLQWGGHVRAKRTLVQLDNMAAGAGSPIYQQAQDEQTNDPGALGEPTKSMDDMPDDVKAMAPLALAHRLIVRPESQLRGRSDLSVIQEILDQTAIEIEEG